jgi:hypothetical protein
MNTKLLSEINAVINDSGLSYPEKVRKMTSLSFDGRPGAKEARETIEKFAEKFRNFSATKAVVVEKDGRLRVNPRWRNRLHVAGEDKTGNVLRNQLIRTEAFARKNAPNYGMHKCLSFVDFLLQKNLYECKDSKVLKRAAGEYYAAYMKDTAKWREYSEKVENFVKETGMPAYEYDRKVPSIIRLQQSNFDCYTQADGWYIFKQTEYETDWNAYSKSWHNAHGPKKSVKSRKLVIVRGAEKISVDVDSYNLSFG